jgi:hypothetical protein
MDRAVTGAGSLRSGPTLTDKSKFQATVVARSVLKDSSCLYDTATSQNQADRLDWLGKASREFEGV